MTGRTGLTTIRSQGKGSSGSHSAVGSDAFWGLLDHEYLLVRYELGVTSLSDSPLWLQEDPLHAVFVIKLTVCSNGQLVEFL